MKRIVMLALLLASISGIAFGQTAIVQKTVLPGASVTLAWDHATTDPLSANLDGFWLIGVPGSASVYEVKNEQLRTLTFKAPTVPGTYKYALQAYLFNPRPGSDVDANNDGYTDHLKSFSDLSNTIEITVVLPSTKPAAPTNLRIVDPAMKGIDVSQSFSLR